MKERLRQTPIRSTDDARRFFDRLAADNTYAHGNPGRSLAYRLGILRRLVRLSGSERILEIGCGTGEHVRALAAEARDATGIDFSVRMIESARRGGGATFLVGDARTLDGIADESMDVVFGIGVLEHIPDLAPVFRSAHRVLRRGGRFACMTVHGEFLWHTFVGPRLGFETRHLSTDRFLTRETARHLLAESQFHGVRLRHWTFVPRGDMPASVAVLLSLCDGVGAALHIGKLRGGLAWVAVK